MNRIGWFGVAFLAFAAPLASAIEVGLVTAVSGNVTLQEGKASPNELKPFVKLREGDRLTMADTPRLQVVYFEGGRQETWQGTGLLEVGTGSSKTLYGNLQPEIRTLPAILVKQISKTPSPDGNVKTGMIRVRSIQPADKLESIEKEYAEMRKTLDRGDYTPELFLLASYFELREFEKLETLLGQLSEKSPGNTELSTLSVLYSKAITEAKKTGKR